MTDRTPTISVTHLFPVLDDLLLQLLRSLTPDEWNTPTIARLWKVKDIAAHLLDGNLRSLSILRDNYFGEQPDIRSYQDLLDFLNRLNADWVKAMQRVSPGMLVFLHEVTGPLYCNYLASLDPFAKSTLAVDWAGEQESLNWMHVAREYTEKWLHQQQIREAVGQPALLNAELFHPFISTFMLGLPHTFRNTDAPESAFITVTVTGEGGGSWHLQRHDGKWRLTKRPAGDPLSEVQIDADTAWKLFSKGLRPDQVHDRVHITGDRVLGETALGMVSVIA